jgi:hypothetical protein
MTTYSFIGAPRLNVRKHENTSSLVPIMGIPNAGDGVCGLTKKEKRPQDEREHYNKLSI